MKMQMTDSEILASYREAKDKGAQVKILAELNACPVQTIKDILIAQGVSPQQLPRTRGKNKPKGGENESANPSAQVTTEENEGIFSKEEEEIIRKTMEDYFTSRAEKRRKEAEERLASMDDTEKRSLEKVGLTLGFSPAEVSAMLYSDKDPIPTREDGKIATNEEEIILLALYALRQRTEDQMAVAESEHAARMKRYNSLLQQVEEIMKKRETDEILKKRETTTETV